MAYNRTLELVYNKLKEEKHIIESIVEMNKLFEELTEIKESIETSTINALGELCEDGETLHNLR